MTLDEFGAAIAKSDEDAKAKAVRELTGEESRVFRTSYRPRPRWMPEDCRDTPTRYLCRCLDYDASNAVKNATADVQWPTALRDIRCDGPHALGATVGQLIGRMLDELDFQGGNETYPGKVNRTDLLCALDDFMSSASKYLMLRHGNDQNVRDAICAVAGCIHITDEHIPSSEDVQPTAALAVTPAEFRQRVTELLELDANRQANAAASKYRKYPKDDEALALLEAAKKKLEALQKKRPNATQAEAVKAVLEEPWGTETKKRKKQRKDFQDRVWHGARGKNDMRENATATRPERLDATTRAATWDKHYKDWGKHLSCYLKHPPAK